MAIVNNTSKDEFVTHQTVPGPPLLNLVTTDDSSPVNADPMFIADRLAIINHVVAYACFIDEGRWDEWYALFSEDITLETSSSEAGPVLIKGMSAFKDFVNRRSVKPEKTSKAVRRHKQGNCRVAEQTATTAKVRAYLLISGMPAADRLPMLTTGTYNADLEKRDGKWTITRWSGQTQEKKKPEKPVEGEGAWTIYVDFNQKGLFIDALGFTGSPGLFY